MLPRGIHLVSVQPPMKLPCQHNVRSIESSHQGELTYFAVIFDHVTSGHFKFVLALTTPKSLDLWIHFPCIEFGAGSIK